jgi:hypothetical protein
VIIACSSGGYREQAGQRTFLCHKEAVRDSTLGVLLGKLIATFGPSGQRSSRVADARPGGRQQS